MTSRISTICCLALVFASLPVHSETPIVPPPENYNIPWVCGGEQQPACSLFFVPTCKSGYKLVDSHFPWGCPTGLICNGHCTLDHEPIAEPDCNCTIPDLSQDDPLDLWGFADIHAHQFTNEGFGGASLWGEAFHEDGIESALAPCGWQKKFETGFYYPLLGYLEASDGFPMFAERGWAAHGTTLAEVPLYHLMSLIIDGTWHEPHGAPLFDDWPRYDRSTHQKMYYRWLERAYKGGLRLMVMLAVNNEAQCSLPIALRRKEDDAGEPYGCDDDGAIQRQIDKAYELEEFVDLEDDGQLNGSGWYRIVLSPDDPDPARPGARQVISSGKLAVVLGIEVDSIFKCKDTNPDCDFDYGRAQAETYIKSQIDAWSNQGVRHFFPVHLINNRFSGTALYKDLWAVTNMLTNADSMQFYDCAAYGVTYNNHTIRVFQDELEKTLRIIKILFPVLDVDSIMYALFGDTDLSDYVGICNGRGLTPEGVFLIDELMKNDLIIDTDHMSYKAFEQTLALADGTDFAYPLVSGHTFMWDYPEIDHEGGDTLTELHRTDSQMQRLLELGGIVAPIMPRQSCNTTVNYAIRYKDALGIARGVEQPYGAEHPGIAFGSDFGAMFHEPVPRFDLIQTPAGKVLEHAQQCDNGEVWGDPLDYGSDGFEIFPGRGRFEKQQTGERVFDYNTDGLAHVGLLPDFMADLKNVEWGQDDGLILAEDDLEPLFRSAETYIRMWEKIKNCTPDQTAPEVWCNAAQTITPPSTPVTFTATGLDKCSVPTVSVRDPYCFKINGAGKKVQVSCHASIEGETITIRNSGGVGTIISWKAVAEDASANVGSESCQVEVVNPGHCQPGENLDLAGTEVGWRETFESCGTISAPDFQVLAPGGDVTLRAGQTIWLGNGFRVGHSCRFTGEIDSGS